MISNFVISCIFIGFPDDSDNKKSACNAENPGSIPGAWLYDLARWPGGVGVQPVWEWELLLLQALSSFGVPSSPESTTCHHGSWPPADLSTEPVLRGPGVGQAWLPAWLGHLPTVTLTETPNFSVLASPRTDGDSYKACGLGCVHPTLSLASWGP